MEPMWRLDYKKFARCQSLFFNIEQFHGHFRRLPQPIPWPGTLLNQSFAG
jgi:hypothetical protein